MKKILALSWLVLLITNLAYAQKMKTLQDSLVVSQKEALALIKRMYEAKILSKAGKAHFEDMVTSQEPEDLYAEYIEAYKPMSYIISEKEVLPKKRSIAVSELLRGLSFIEHIYSLSKEKHRITMRGAKPEKFNAKIKGFCGVFLLNFLENKPQYVASLHQKLQEIGILPIRIKLPFVLENEETIIVVENYFQLAGEAVYFFESYEKLKEEQIQQLVTLKNEGILTASNYEKLINGYAPYQIYSNTEVLMLCEKAVVIDLENSANDTAVFFEKIRATIFPDIQLKIIGKYHDTITTEYNHKIGRAYIKFRIEDQEYHLTNVPQQHQMTAGWVVYPPLSALNSEDISFVNIQVFNDYLMDKGSDKRLYQMTDEVFMEGLRANFLARSKIGFILLDSIMLEKVPFFKKIHRNNEHNAYLKNTLKRPEIKAFVTQLSAIQFVNNNNVEEIVVKLIRDEARSYERILWALPHTVVKLDRLERCYECEEEDDMQPSFKQYMADFTQISRLQFLPTEVKETKISDKEYKLSFVWKDKRYEKSMNLPARFYSSMEGMSEMTTWINNVLQEQKATGKFDYLGTYSFDALYLTPAQHSFLSKYITLRD